jgi:hypothetical protein
MINFREVLEEHRKTCEIEGKYVGNKIVKLNISIFLNILWILLKLHVYIKCIEAEMAKNRITELKF